MDLPVLYSKVTQEERNAAREEYVRRQKGKCWFCRAPLDADASSYVLAAEINWKWFPDGFQRAPVHLHHSHTTGLTIGAVHMRCNAYLWQYLHQ